MNDNYTIYEFFCGRAIVTVLHSRYALIPSGPNSLPIPDCLNPPKGVCDKTAS